jgi:hypothetical protein
MLKTTLVMATITLIACAAVIVVFELLYRNRAPQAGSPPRRRAF